MNLKKKRNIIILIILILFFIIALSVILFIPKIDHSNYVSLINHNWNLDMPYCDEKVYYVDNNNVSPLGDGDRYSILKYEIDEKINKINKMQWSDTLISDKKDMVIQALEKFNVPHDKKVDFEKNLLYLTATRSIKDELIMAYDKDEELIYVFERFY